MVGNEWTSYCTSRNHIHHGCLNLQKVTIIQILPHAIDNLGTNLKCITIFMIDHKVQISLTISRFRVGQCFCLTSLGKGEHVKTGTKELNFQRENGQLSLLGFSRYTPYTNNISTLDGAMNLLKCVLTRLVRFEIRHDLQLGTISSNIIKEKFTLSTNGCNTSSYRHSSSLKLFTLSSFLHKFSGEVWKTIVNVEFVGVGSGSFSLDLLNSIFTVFLVSIGIEDFFLLFFLLLGISCFLGSLHIDIWTLHR
mmetsp:Transcript_2402/g.2767  ORF Transcript_2402/g.2767 Transcript_2402/m.2767 type:complete len:251 (-) Transcript_2402:81-833(-)